MGTSVIDVLLDPPHVQDHSLSNYKWMERLIRPWSSVTDNTVYSMQVQGSLIHSILLFEPSVTLRPGQRKTNNVKVRDGIAT